MNTHIYACTFFEISWTRYGDEEVNLPDPAACIRIIASLDWPLNEEAKAALRASKYASPSLFDDHASAQGGDEKEEPADDATSKNALASYFEQGEAFLCVGEFAKAVEAYEKATKAAEAIKDETLVNFLAKDKGLAYFAKAEALSALGQFDLAIDSFKKANVDVLVKTKK